MKYLAKARALDLPCICIHCLREAGITPLRSQQDRHEPPSPGGLIRSDFEPKAAA